MKAKSISAVIAVAIAAALTLVACGSDSFEASEGTTAPEATAPETTVPPTTEAPTTTVPETTVPPITEAPTTTVKAECVNGASENRNVTDASYDAWRCVGGVWTFSETIAIAPPTTAAPIEYVQLSERDWKLLVKDPDAHKGENILIYGYVTQFDAATGDTIFRANVDGVEQADYFDYDVNAFMGVATGDDRLADVVEGDIFVAEVTVGGSTTYDTSIGGSTTVPLFLVNSITVTGSTD